jgi:hypothetical protein
MNQAKTVSPRELTNDGHQQNLRCSNGSLVDRISECPSSDACLSSIPSGNDALQCSPKCQTSTEDLEQVINKTSNVSSVMENGNNENPENLTRK